MAGCGRSDVLLANDCNWDATVIPLISVMLPKADKLYFNPGLAANKWGQLGASSLIPEKNKYTIAQKAMSAC